MNVTALQPGSKVGGYEVKRLLGAGGFGMTYEGFNPITRNRVAIKELFPKGIVSRQGATIIIGDQRDQQVFQSVLKKFEESTTKLAQLQHGNIVKVFDYIPGNNTGYMMMEYIEGDILAGLLEKSPSRALPSEAEFARIFQPILDALAYVHANNLIHRDISPDNIMIDKTGRPVLIDFGAFKEMDQTNRASTLMVAREAYAPPEQGVVDGIAHMPYTDIYALGATMYETLAGEPPIRAAKRVFVKVDPYVPLAQKAKVPLSPSVAAAIDKCLRLPAEERPQSIAELVGLMGWDATRIAPPRQQTGPVPGPTVLAPPGGFQPQPNFTAPPQPTRVPSGVQPPAQFPPPPQWPPQPGQHPHPGGFQPFPPPHAQQTGIPPPPQSIGLPPHQFNYQPRPKAGGGTWAVRGLIGVVVAAVLGGGIYFLVSGNRADINTSTVNTTTPTPPRTTTTPSTTTPPRTVNVPMPDSKTITETPPNLSTIPPGTFRSVRNIETEVSCQNLCRSTSGCGTHQYVSDTKECRLWAVGANPTPLPPRTTPPPTQTTTPPPTTTTRRPAQTGGPDEQQTTTTPPPATVTPPPTTPPPTTTPNRRPSQTGGPEENNVNPTTPPAPTQPTAPTTPQRRPAQTGTR